VYAAGGAAAVAVVAAAVIGFILVRDSGGGGTKTTTPTNYNGLPGIRRTKAPWPVNSAYYATLADRLAPLGLQTLSQEGVATHIHAHLDVFVNGKRVTVPQAIGINPGAGWLTELHTHDTRGVIHIESPKANDTFTLGQFVAEWGVFLNGRCIGAYCDGLKWYVNGKQQTGNPAGLVLKPHQEIALVVGKPPKTIPPSFKFSAGE
jgi:hypothetical protein